jgi:hypothetical protein
MALIVGLLLMGSLGEALQTADELAGIDFYQFWVVAQANGLPTTGNVYSQKARREVGRLLAEERLVGHPDARLRTAARARQTLETFSTPFLYTTFRVVSLRSYNLSYSLYQVLCLAATVGAVILLCRLHGFGWTPALLAVALFTGMFEPFRSHLRVMNVSPIQLAALALFLAAERRAAASRGWGVAGGCIMGLSILFKPNTAAAAAMVCVLWIVDGQVAKVARLCGGMLLGIALAVTVSCWSFGTARCWLDWAAAVRSLDGQGVIAVSMGNCSVVQWLAEQTGVSISLALGAVLSAATVLAMWRGRRRRGRQEATDEPLERTALAVGIGCAIMLLAAPLAWMHYYVLTIPLIVCLLRPGGAGAEAPMAARALAALATLLLCSRPIVALTGWDIPPVYAALYPCAALLLTAAGLWDLAGTGDPSAMARTSDQGDWGAFTA